MADLLFTLDLREPQRHYIRVTCVAARHMFDADGEWMLPVWTPGSYLIREFANQLGPVCAFDAESGSPLRCAKTRKNRYRIDVGPAVALVRIEYSVYAHELTVRTADLTSEHAFWNHACVLLWPVDSTTPRGAVRVLLPDGWDMACAGGHEAISATERVLATRSLDELVDTPVLCGSLTRLRRSILGVPHELVVDDIGSVQVSEVILDDVSRVVEQAAAVFDSTLPYADYTFLCLLTDKGHGGLEHSTSSALLASRTALRPGKAYREFMGLLAHELFHAWNVKRMRPRELWQYDYETENHTELLWLAEGFTAYYDDLLCRRAGILTVEDYLTAIGRNVRNMHGAGGRLRQSLSEASYDAWIRFYRQDENTRNSTQNYYGNGAVVAMVLDLVTRRATDGRRSLDDAMRELYRSTYCAGRGYDFDDVVRCCSWAAGENLGPVIEDLVRGPLDPDLEPLLVHFGIEIDRPEHDKPFLGFVLSHGTTTVASVTDGGPAHISGLAPGDDVLAIDGLRVSPDRWADIVAARLRIDCRAQFLVSSRGIVRERTVVPTRQVPPPMELRLGKNLAASTIALRRAWLAEDVALSPSARD